MKCSENFEIQDLVSSAVFAAYELNSINFIDRKLIVFLEKLRQDLKSEIIINTWQYTADQLTLLNERYGTTYSLDTRLEYRGYREPACPTTDDIQVQHRFGRAVDFDVIGMSAAQVRTWIIQNFIGGYRMYGLTAIEMTAAWVHCDFRLVTIHKEPLVLVEFTDAIN